jgi:hypothetical protein
MSLMPITLQQVDMNKGYHNQAPPPRSQLLSHVNLAGHLLDNRQNLQQKLPWGRSPSRDQISDNFDQQPEASSSLDAMPRMGQGNWDREAADAETEVDARTTTKEGL